MRDVLTSLVTNLHILALSLLLTALSLGVVGPTPDKKSASGERWRVIIMEPDTSETPAQPPTEQPAAHAYAPKKPDVPWRLGSTL